MRSLAKRANRGSPKDLRQRRRGDEDAGVLTTAMQDNDLDSVMGALRIAEDLRQRALRLHDEEMREVIVVEFERASNDLVVELVRRERLADEARRFGVWGG